MSTGNTAADRNQGLYRVSFLMPPLPRGLSCSVQCASLSLGPMLSGTYDPETRSLWGRPRQDPRCPQRRTSSADADQPRSMVPRISEVQPPLHFFPTHPQPLLLLSLLPLLPPPLLLPPPPLVLLLLLLLLHDSCFLPLSRHQLQTLEVRNMPFSLGYWFT